jgi:Predicted transcriptional regulator
LNTSERRFSIYIQLLDNQILNKSDLANKYDVTPRAIQRDISQINSAFADNALPYTIQYEKVTAAITCTATNTLLMPKKFWL